MAVELTEYLIQFAVAAGIGGMVGVEREHRGDQSTVLAGVRTFPLISLAGFLTAFLATATGETWVLPAGILGSFGLALMFIQVRRAMSIFGITTPVAIVVTYLLGILVGLGFLLEAVVAGVATTFLLVTKKRLHRFAQVLDDAEILSALQFITLLFILLPLTADLQPGRLGVPWIGRGAILDPYTILLVVVFVSSISFASLVAMRTVGPSRGLQVSGMLGGLVNSEATTASLAQRAQEREGLVAPALVGTLLATGTMLARNLAIAGFGDPTLRLAGALLPFFLVLGSVIAFVAWRAQRRVVAAEVETIRVGSPFAVGPALKFALIFAGASLVIALARAQLGDVGVYIASLGGFVSAGAVLASLGSLYYGGAIPLEVALRTGLLATAASVLAKPFIVHALHREMFRRGLVAYVTTSIVAIGAALTAFLVT